VRAFRLARSVASGMVQPLWLSWMAPMAALSALYRSLTVVCDGGSHDQAGT